MTDPANTDLLKLIASFSDPNSGLSGMDAFKNTLNVNPTIPTNTDMFSMESMFGGKNSNGWLTAGIGALTGGIGAYTGIKQLGLAEDTLALQKEAYSTNMANQTKLTNDQLIAQQEYINRNYSDRAIDMDTFKANNLLPSTYQNA